MFRRAYNLPRATSTTILVGRVTTPVTRQLTCFDNPEHSVEGLAAYSHVWLFFWFHKNGNKSIRPKVCVGRASRLCPFSRALNRQAYLADCCRHCAGAAAAARRRQDRRVCDALAPPAEPRRPHARTPGERRGGRRLRVRCVPVRSIACDMGACVSGACCWRLVRGCHVGYV